MRRDIHNKRRRNGLLLAALVGAVPTASLAWWGPPGPGPMWGTPGFSGPPGPPSVGQFMNNPWGYRAPSRRYGRRRYGPSYQRFAAQPARVPSAIVPARAIAPWVAMRARGTTIAAPVAAIRAPAFTVFPRPVAIVPAATAVPARRAAARTPAPATPGPNAAVVPAASASPPVAKPDPGAGAEGTTVGVEDTPRGRVLVDSEGMSLYIYGRDPLGASSCSGGCAESWPPALAAAGVTVGGNLSVITRADGSKQWAYRGRPLYRWVHDAKPGDTNGDGKGGVWKLARAE
jgi:predicted lipoprotein with Yx(FWY)xxD motif